MLYELKKTYTIGGKRKLETETSVTTALHLHYIAHFHADPGIRAHPTLALLMHEMHTCTAQECLCMQITLTLLRRGRYQLLRYLPDNEHSVSARACVFASACTCLRSIQQV